MRRLLVPALAALLVLTGLGLRPRPTAASPATSKEVITTLANGLLLVTIPDPPRGTSYQGDYALSVPDGEQWHVLSVSFNDTTAPWASGQSGSRRLKWCLRDPTDPINPGRLFTVLVDGLGDYVYKDFSLQIGQNLLFGKLGPGSLVSQIRSPANAALADLWIPAGFQWATVNEGETDRDQFSFFFALVEDKPL
jgi:hypothetical protein